MDDQSFLLHELTELRNVSGINLALPPEEDPYWLCLVLQFVLADSLLNDLNAMRQAKSPEVFITKKREMPYQDFFDHILKLIPAYIDIDAYRRKTGREFFISTPLVEQIMDYYCLTPSLLRRQLENIQPQEPPKEEKPAKIWIYTGCGIVFGTLIGACLCRFFC